MERNVYFEHIRYFYSDASEEREKGEICWQPISAFFLHFGRANQIA